jgi:BirA family biotin operon repressor/biotin-[acetyl-CoA-carboxylase] ligase
MTFGIPATLFIGNHLVRLDEVDSTNTFALNLLRQSEIAEGTVVIARSQTAGRGQRGNTWISQEGKNLTCSIILKPVFLSVTSQFDLTRAIALGIADFLSDLLQSSSVCIKWPNDIYIDTKKICGILIENILNGNQISASVIGIGLNVNQSEFSEGLSNATSIFKLTELELKVDDLYKILFSYVEARYLQLRAGAMDKLREEYDARLFRRGEMGNFSDFKEVFEAKVEGVSAEGMLVLKGKGGEERRFGFKEVGFL